MEILTRWKGGEKISEKAEKQCAEFLLRTIPYKPSDEMAKFNKSDAQLIAGLERDYTIFLIARRAYPDAPQPEPDKGILSEDEIFKQTRNAFSSSCNAFFNDGEKASDERFRKFSNSLLQHPCLDAVFGKKVTIQ